MPQAIVQLVKSYYGEDCVKIEVFYNSDRMEILDETLKLLSEVKEVKVTQFNSDNFYYHGYYNDAIFLFDTIDNYLKTFHRKIAFARPQRTVELINFLVYCENLSKNKLQAVLTVNRFESFLIDENDQISLHLMTMDTEKQCNTPQLIEGNRFSDKERKWTKKKFLAPTIDNFHGCGVYVKYYSDFDQLPFVSSNRDEGVLFDMMNALAPHLNFTITFDRSYKKLLNGLYYDFEQGVFLAQSSRFESGFSLSDPFYSSASVFLVPPGEPYTSWEKLLLPFDQQTWMWLIITFAVAFLIIFLIKLRRSASMYEFVVGSNVTTPTLNVVAIFMGIGQILLPRRNVARFLFMCFVLFCLIMRTAYQGMYFEFLTSDKTKKPIASIEEMEDKNITVYISDMELMYFRVKNFDVISR